MAAPTTDPPSDAPGEGEHVEIFPPPPPHYRLFGPDAAAPPPAPPPPVKGEYTVFGEIYTTEDGAPPLQGRALFQPQADGSLDFRATLLALTRDLLHNYIDLTDALARRPSAYGRCVEAVGACARNAAFLLNALRPRQAAAGVAAALEDDAKRWNEEAERLEQAVAAHDAAVEAAARELEKAA